MPHRCGRAQTELGRHQQLHEARDKKEKEPSLSRVQQGRGHTLHTAGLTLGAEMKMKQQL